jgi:hypothetical protein
VSTRPSIDPRSPTLAPALQNPATLANPLGTAAGYLTCISALVGPSFSLKAAPRRAPPGSVCTSLTSDQLSHPSERKSWLSKPLPAIAKARHIHSFLI